MIGTKPSRGGYGGGKIRPNNALTGVDRQATRFWLLVAFLVFVSLTGGGSRPDISSLVILRPVAILLCAGAGWMITADELRQHRFVLGMIAVTVGLTAFHLIPLPPALWHLLPGREIVTQIDLHAGLGQPWRPISLAPSDTRNALFSLFVPLAALLVGVGLRRAQLERLLLIFIVFGCISGLLGLLQLLGPPAGPLYLYTHTNYGVATGLFANRNHQALFLATLFPMLATWVTMRAATPHATRDGYAAVAIGIFLLPLLLITGSRAGMLAGAVGFLSIPFLLRLEPGRQRGRDQGGKIIAVRRGRWSMPSRRVLLAAGLAGAIGLVALTIGLSRAAAVSRLLDIGAEDELRFKVWPVIFETIPTYFPIGSGIGSFVPVFQIVEPDRILRPTFLNHAHNELLEILLTAGLPGGALVLAGVVAWLVAARRAFAVSINETGVLYARLGVVVTGLLAIGSIGDYPLRTPFLAALFAIAALWASSLRPRSAR
jgi:O-antigen ligase